MEDQVLVNPATIAKRYDHHDTKSPQKVSPTKTVAATSTGSPEKQQQQQQQQQQAAAVAPKTPPHTPASPSSTFTVRTTNLPTRFSPVELVTTPYITFVMDEQRFYRIPTQLLNDSAIIRDYVRQGMSCVDVGDCVTLEVMEKVHEYLYIRASMRPEVIYTPTQAMFILDSSGIKVNGIDISEYIQEPKILRWLFSLNRASIHIVHHMFRKLHMKCAMHYIAVFEAYRLKQELISKQANAEKKQESSTATAVDRSASGSIVQFDQAQISRALKQDVFSAEATQGVFDHASKTEHELPEQEDVPHSFGDPLFKYAPPDTFYSRVVKEGPGYFIKTCPRTGKTHKYSTATMDIVEEKPKWCGCFRLYDAVRGHFVNPYVSKEQPKKQEKVDSCSASAGEEDVSMYLSA